jgi:hypothetical protein
MKENRFVSNLVEDTLIIKRISTIDGYKEYM